MDKVLKTNADGRPWQWEEDGMIVTRSHARSAPGCHTNCGVLTYVKDGKLVKVEGDPDNPFNNGRLCPRCLALKDVVYSPDRLQQPLVRDGERGENKWKRVSWDEALDLIADKFKKIIEEHGPESIVFQQGTGRDIFAYISRLAYGIGSPNWGHSFLMGNACYLPRINAMMVFSGAANFMDCAQALEDRYDDPQYEIPGCIITWGNNTIATNPDGFYGHWIVDLMQRGAKLINVDPRLNWLSAHAEYWLQLRPGTDAALALGMLNVIINEDLYDHEFVEKWCYGFEELRERVQDYPPSKVAEITWVPEDKIVGAARLFATSKPASIKWGLKVDQNTNGIQNAQAVMALWCITGNVDNPGGMLLGTDMMSEPVPWQSKISDVSILSQEAQDKRLGGKEYPMLSFGFTCTQPNAMVRAIETGEPYPILAGWWQTTNPIACTSTDARRALEVLKKIPFNVVVDLFMTPTAIAIADVVLPTCTIMERNGSSGIAEYYIGAAAITKAIDPLYETKADAQINLELGKRIKPENFAWDSWDDWNATELRGITWEELQSNVYMYNKGFQYKKHEKGLLRSDGQPGFNTPTGKLELYSTLLEAWGLDPLPYYEELSETPISKPQLAKEYPLILTTGVRPWVFFHSEHRMIPRLRRVKPDPQVEIHPDVADQLGIVDGEWVMVENQRGKARFRAKITRGIDPRVVMADHAWWFPERSPEDHGFGPYDCFKSNINLLTRMDTAASGFGADYIGLLCRVRKIEEGE